MLPNEKAALRIGGHRITRRFKKALCEVAGLQELKEDIIDRQDGVKHLISLMQWIGKCIREHNVT
jgi:hypothetical protein